MEIFPRRTKNTDADAAQPKTENSDKKNKKAQQQIQQKRASERVLGPIVGSPIPQNFRTLEKYPLFPPFAYAVIAEDPDEGLPYYYIDELELTDEEKEIHRKIVGALQLEVKAPKAGIDSKKYFAEQARRTVNRYRMMKRGSATISWAKLLYYTERDMVGFGPIDPLMRDKNIEDISLDSVRKPVFVYHKKYETLETNLKFDDEQKLDDMIVRLVHMSGKHVSTAFPIVDATLPGKHRLSATFRREVSPQGSSMTIRKFREDPITIIDLINFRMLDFVTAAYAWLLIENRAASMVVGATASGKTTFLNALLSMINPNSKLVTIEEVQEINIHHVNWTPLVSRMSYGLSEGSTGEISLFQLVKAAMRMRPDVLVVGEVRGEEAYALFQAISTGHGGLATLHADDTKSAVQRLVSKPMDVAPAYINFLDLTFSVRRVVIPNNLNPDSPKIVRRVISVDEILSADKQVRVFSWDPQKDRFDAHLEDSVKLRILAKDRGKSTKEILEEIDNRIKVLQWLVSKNIRNFVEVSIIFSQYHNDPKNLLKRLSRETTPIEGPMEISKPTAAEQQQEEESMNAVAHQQ